MTLRDCTCRHCLCYRGTRDETSLCTACQKDRHPGDPRPAGWFFRTVEQAESLQDRPRAFAAAPNSIADHRPEPAGYASGQQLE